jgi:hypothetical protein
VNAALAFAPHSGWAAVVGVCDIGAQPHVLVRERIEMSDPLDTRSKQPYHAVENLPIDEAAARLASYASTAESLARHALDRIVDQLAKLGHRPIGLGILGSAGRKGSALPDILASHALIHTADGDHFRNAIAAAATRCGLTVHRVRARDLDARAATVFEKPAETLQVVVKGLGRDIGPPWGADQKAAALLAWLVLATASQGDRGRTKT